jgi:signal transduction histidine kinase
MDFTAVAHDLRTPLNAMLGHTRLLAIETLSDSGRRRLDIIEAQIHRMATLIDSYLPHPEVMPPVAQVDLKNELRAVVAELDPLLQQRRIQVLMVGTDPLPPVAGDTDALHRVLVNLMVNAADSMPDGGRILIRARTAQVPIASVTAVTIDIIDSGTGIPLDIVAHVFERGFTTKHPGQGAGLGLAICREIMHDHGGLIELSTEPGAGTTVRLCLPTCGGVVARQSNRTRSRRNGTRRAAFPIARSSSIDRGVWARPGQERESR